MAVAFGHLSESHTGTTGNTSADSFTWTHNTSGDRAIVVFVWTYNSAIDYATGVTVSGRPADDLGSAGTAIMNSAEVGSLHTYFIDAVPQSTTAAIVVTRTNNTTPMYAAAFSFSVTAGKRSEVYVPGMVNIATTGSNTTDPAEQNVDDGSPGANSVRCAAMISGRNSVTGAGGNSTGTTTTSADLGTTTFQSVYETTAGQGARPVGFATGAADDTGFIGLAVREMAALTLDGIPAAVMTPSQVPVRRG